MIRRFIQWNRKLSLRLAEQMPNWKGHTYRVYPGACAERLKEDGVHTVLDMGGGKTCAYTELIPEGWHGKLIGADIAPDELRHNNDVDARLVCDATAAYPFNDGEVDLLTSRSVLEHLSDLDAFFSEAARVMKPGGYCVHWIPCKFAPFAVINAMLPNWLARKILFFLDESKIGICGFPVVYDRCYPSALRKLLETHGFEVVSLQPSYYQSSYFAFFVPAFLVSSLYENLLLLLGAENLCAHMLVVARRR